MIELDTDKIANSLVILFVGGGITWLFGSVLKLRKDMNHAHRKIRGIEDDQAPMAVKDPLDCTTISGAAIRPRGERLGFSKPRGLRRSAWFDFFRTPDRDKR